MKKRPLIEAKESPRRLMIHPMIVSIFCSIVFLIFSFYGQETDLNGIFLWGAIGFAAYAILRYIGDWIYSDYDES